MKYYYIAFIGQGQWVSLVGHPVRPGMAWSKGWPWSKGGWPRPSGSARG